MKKFRFLPLLFLFVCLLAGDTFAQLVYPRYTAANRPGDLDWQELNTPHFRLIFPSGEDSSAFTTGRILEQQYPLAQKLAGGSLSRFPVILKNYSDRANGFVTPMNFRMEFDLAPFKAKGINPASGNWMEAVLPHELVHASQGNVNKFLSLPGLASILSPDIARIVNFYPPAGVHEGLAVYQESHFVLDGGGRGNLGFFNNQFNANLDSDQPWNMGQTLLTSSRTIPYDRHYISGYTFTNWLQDTYGEDASMNAIRFHYSYFFFGYGLALKHVTGKWPAELYEEYNEAMNVAESTRLSGITNRTEDAQELHFTSFNGAQMRKPLWLNENTILYYGTFYNARPGFYTYDLNTDKTRLLSETIAVSDYNYQVLAGNKLLYSTYTPGVLYSSAFKADLITLDLGSGKTEKLTQKKRVYSPALIGSTTLALQTSGSSANIVTIRGGVVTDTLKEFTQSIPVGLIASTKESDKLAVLINKRGVQALWITSLKSLPSDLDGAPTIAFKEGSVYDPQWHPTENKLLFSVDRSTAVNVYELDLNSGTVFQITDSKYNAYEASYSPDGETIAYIVQKDNEKILTTLNRKDFFNNPVGPASLLSDTDFEERQNLPVIGSEISVSDWTVKTYRTFPGWLKPRGVFPVFRQGDGTSTIQWGMAMFSTDPLQRQAYYGEITGINDRLYFDIDYNLETFAPGLGLSLSTSPVFGYYQNQSSTRVDEEFEISTSQSFILRQDTRLTYLSFRPSYTINRFRYYTLQNESITGHYQRQYASLFTQFVANVLTLPRDVQPSAGIGTFTLLEQDVTSDFINKRAVAYGGVFGYLSPLRKFNQSLRLDLQFLSQTSGSRFYSNSTIIPQGFTDRQSFDAATNLARLSTRYAIPIAFPDNGWLTVPVYLNYVYLGLFSHTITDLNARDLYKNSRSVYGASLNFSFKVSNFDFILELGLAYEPTRNQTEFILGDF